jgi:hypothetical protein
LDTNSRVDPLFIRVSASTNVIGGLKNRGHGITKYEKLV